LNNTQQASGVDGNNSTHSLNIQEKAAVKIIEKYFSPKANIVWGIPLERMSKELAMSRCLRIKSIDFHLLQCGNGKDNGKEGRNCPGFQ
jgi:hypothetical protein